METNDSLSANFVSVGIAIIVLVFSNSADNQTIAFAIAYVVAGAALLSCTYQAAHGNERQVTAAPITAVLLMAVFSNFHGPHHLIMQYLVILLVGVTLGISVLAAMVPRRGPNLVLFLGALVGVVGISLDLAALNLHLPGSGLFVTADHIQSFNPFHVDFFPQRSQAELDAARLHNAALQPKTNSFMVLLFLVQSAAVSAWDAAILSLGVWIAGLVAIPLVLKFTSERS